MRVWIATALFAGLALAGAAQPPDKQPDKQPEKKPDKEPEKKPENPPSTDPKLLVPPAVEGGYTVASAERDGKPIPKEQFKDAIVRFTGGRVVGTDRDRRELLVATYVLNDKRQPWRLEMKHYGSTETTSGLVKKEGYVLTLIYALPGAEAPTEFKTKEGQVMLVLRGFVLDPVPPPNKFSHSP